MVQTYQAALYDIMIDQKNNLLSHSINVKESVKIVLVF